MFTYLQKLISLYFVAVRHCSLCCKF